MWSQTGNFAKEHTCTLSVSALELEALFEHQKFAGSINGIYGNYIPFFYKSSAYAINYEGFNEIMFIYVYIYIYYPIFLIQNIFNEMSAGNGI